MEKSRHSSFSTDSDLEAAAMAGAELYGPDPNGESSTEVPCFLMLDVEITLIFRCTLGAV